MSGLLRGFIFYAACWAFTTAWELTRSVLSNQMARASAEAAEKLTSDERAEIGETKIHVMLFLIHVVMCSALGSIWWLWWPIKLHGLFHKSKGVDP